MGVYVYCNANGVTKNDPQQCILRQDGERRRDQNGELMEVGRRGKDEGGEGYRMPKGGRGASNASCNGDGYQAGQSRGGDVKTSQ